MQARCTGQREYVELLGVTGWARIAEAQSVSLLHSPLPDDRFKMTLRQYRTEWFGNIPRDLISGLLVALA